MHLVLKATKVKKVKGDTSCMGQLYRSVLMAKKAKSAGLRSDFFRLHGLEAPKLRFTTTLLGPPNLPTPMDTTVSPAQGEKAVTAWTS